MKVFETEIDAFSDTGHSGRNLRHHRDRVHVFGISKHTVFIQRYDSGSSHDFRAVNLQIADPFSIFQGTLWYSANDRHW